MNNAENKFLPFAQPQFDEDEINEVVDTIRSGWLTTGPKTKKFEEDFSSYIGAKYALAVNSATAGLHLSLEAAGLCAGDFVVTTPYTFPATAEVIRYFDAHPLFVDINAKTLNIDTEILELEIIKAHNTGKKVTGIIPVHFAGQACEMDRIMEIAEKYSLFVVEDAAHALPTTYNGKKIGTIGDSTVFSFYVTKTLATGEGGMVVTNNEKWAKRIKTMRLHGINRDVWDRYTGNQANWHYDVVEAGFKYNMPDIAASLGIHQLKKVDQFQKRRQWIANMYNNAFADLPVTIPHNQFPGNTHAWHLYVLQLEKKAPIQRDEFIKKMSVLGIGTSVHFIPLHIHPYYKKKYGYEPSAFPKALNAYENCVSLPLYTKMSNTDIERVISTTRYILAGK